MRENKVRDLGALLEEAEQQREQKQKEWNEILSRIQNGQELIYLGLNSRDLDDGFSWQNSDFYKNIEVLKMRGLIITDFWVYCVLTSFWNTKEEACYPSYRAIAKRVGRSIPTVKRSIKRLEDVGIILVQRRPWKTNKYFLPKIEGIL